MDFGEASYRKKMENQTRNSTVNVYLKSAHFIVVVFSMKNRFRFKLFSELKWKKMNIFTVKVLRNGNYSKKLKINNEALSLSKMLINVTPFPAVNCSRKRRGNFSFPWIFFRWNCFLTIANKNSTIISSADNMLDPLSA